MVATNSPEPKKPDANTPELSPEEHAKQELEDMNLGEKPRPKNLQPVLRIIPKTCYDNPTWKGLAYAARDYVVYFGIIGAIAMTDQWYYLLPLWFLSGLIISGLFIVGHDAGHQSLFKSKKLNDIVGKICMLPGFHVYEGWCYGHNRVHHGHTVRQGFDFVWHPYTVDDYQKLSPFNKFMHKIEWSWFGSGMYYARHIWWHKMMDRNDQPPKWKDAIVRDINWVWGFILVSSAIGGTWGWFHYADAFASAPLLGSILGAIWVPIKTVFIPAFAFMYVIGFAVYVHHISPEIKWWPRRDWNKFKGQMEGTTIIKLGWGWDFFFHSIFTHVPHHVDMRIPFYHLDDAADAIMAEFPEVVRSQDFSMSEYFRCAKQCKVYDFEKQEWLRYDQIAA